MVKMKKGGASCGLGFNSVPDIQSSLQAATANGYDFMVVPIVNPSYRIDTNLQKQRNSAFTRPDLLLGSSEWNSLIVGRISRHLNLESTDAKVRKDSENTLQTELNYATHLGLPAVMFDVNGPNNVNLSRMIYSYLLKTHNSQVWVRIPLNKTEKMPSDPWHWWDQFRSNINTEKRVNVVLVLDKEFPNADRLRRWIGEPVKALVISTNLFLVNKKGFPVLPKSVQSVVKAFFALKVQFIIEGRNVGHDHLYYQQYLDHMAHQENIAIDNDPLKKYASGYEDFLQSPLQPLMDNLESGTYEVFEKDPVKYREYQNAIYHALVDRVDIENLDKIEVVVMVLGAGRGPLVRATLRASESSGRKVKVIAVEKNTNAVVTLQAQKDEQWGDKVEVVSGDMREWKDGGIKADIIVSELLGSFGDNELSPECLYSAQHLFKKDAISIPSSYTSFVGPLQSAKLYQEVRASFDREKNPNYHFETPYVVHLQNRTELAQPQPLFTFDHPCWDEKIENTRYKVKTFEIEMDSELHGFGGYFECTLYKDIMISINPTTHSPGMFSWFPIFFPLKAPMKLKEGDKLELHFWRLNNSKEVWYEWCITNPIAVPIHNPNGRSYTIGL